MHTHLSEIAAALETLGDRVTCQHLMLKHFSTKYTRERVLELVSWSPRASRSGSAAWVRMLL